MDTKLKRFVVLLNSRVYQARIKIAHVDRALGYAVAVPMFHGRCAQPNAADYLIGEI